MSIRKVGAFWHYDITVHKGKKEIRRKGSTKNRKHTRNDALLFEASKRQQLLADLGLSGLMPSFKQFARRFQAYAAVNKPAERASKETILRLHLVPFFGEVPLDEVEGEKIAKYIEEKLSQLLPGKRGKAGETYGKKSVNNHLGVLSIMLNTAVRWKVMHKAPEIKLMRLDLPPYDFLSAEEVQKVLATPGEPAFVMALAGLTGGYRISEMIALRWPNVNLVNAKIVIRESVWRGRLRDFPGGEEDEEAVLPPIKDYVGAPKGGTTEEVPMSTMLVSAMKALPSRFAGGLVFPGPDGELLKREDLHRSLTRLCKLAGIREVTWHVFRHTFASHLVMKGVPLKAVQQLMRHKSITMTLRYAHLSPQVGPNAVDLLYKPDALPFQPAQKVDERESG